MSPCGFFLSLKSWRKMWQASSIMDTYCIHLRSLLILLLLVPFRFLLRYNMRGRHRPDLTPLALFVIAGAEYAAILVSKVAQLPVEFAAPAALPIHLRCCGSFGGCVWRSRMEDVRLGDDCWALGDFSWFLMGYR